MRALASARMGKRALVAISAALAVILTSASIASAATAIVITKKTDQSSPELFNNFSDTANIGGQGQLAWVSGTIACDGGQSTQGIVRVRVEVQQGGVVAEGHTIGRCTGDVEGWSAVVVVRGNGGLVPGAAEAHAWVGTPPSHNGIVSAYDWTHTVELQK